MKPAAFLDLPMKPRRFRVVDLDAIDSEVVFLCDRMLGVDERECEKRTAVFLPRRQHRQFVETRRAIDNLRDWRTIRVLRSEFQNIQRDRTMFPELSGTRR